jgi:hypothetical protein
MTDQLERVRSILSKVTYKPGWILQVAYAPKEWQEHCYLGFRRIQLLVRFKTKDVFTPDKEITLCNQIFLTEYDLEHLDDGQIVDYLIRRVIWEAEDHEFKE